MKYEEIVDWLFQQVPNYQHQGGIAYKPGLDRIEQLLKSVDNPHHKIKTIHVAGTNGKGSVTHMLSAIFQEHGYRVGLFTSPHIRDFRERIKINGAWISREFVVDFFNQNKEAFHTVQPSFFEITTAMAFQAFENEKCDIAIIETGLGGRLDSTNVLLPELSIITNIGIDHVGFLGDTLEQIAKEKAGIIKPQIPAVIGGIKPELRGLFEKQAEEKKSLIYFSEDEEKDEIHTDLLGQFQQRNLHTTITAVKRLQDDWNLKRETIHEALTKVAVLTNFHGRLEKIGDSPLILFDAAHNEDGIRNLLSEIAHFDYRELRIIYGASNDKNWKDIIKIFPREAIYYFSEFKSHRTVKCGEFELEVEPYNLIFNTFQSPEDAFHQCKSDAHVKDLILVCGSFYLLEKII